VTPGPAAVPALGLCVSGNRRGEKQPCVCRSSERDGSVGRDTTKDTRGVAAMKNANHALFEHKLRRGGLRGDSGTSARSSLGRPPTSVLISTIPTIQAYETNAIEFAVLCLTCAICRF
jgi:hypothetical protein